MSGIRKRGAQPESAAESKSSSVAASTPTSSSQETASPSTHKYLEYAADAVLILVSIAIYLNSLNGDFVFDDRVAVVENKDVKPEVSGIMEVFRDNYWGDLMGVPTARHHSYRPLTVLSFRWTYMFFGMNTLFFHLGNVLINASVAVQLERCLRLVLQGIDSSNVISFAAALLFSTHPVHTEAVAGIVGRADLLAALFSCFAFLSYAKALPSGEIKPADYSPKYIIHCVLYATAAILCKETGATIIICCAAYDVLVVCRMNQADGIAFFSEYFGGKKGPKHVRPAWMTAFFRRQMLLLGLTVFVIFVRFGVNKDDVVLTDWMTNPSIYIEDFVLRTLTKSYYSVLHFMLLVWPVNLSCDWACLSVPLIDSLSDPRNLQTAALFGSLVVFTLVILLRRPSEPQGRVHQNFVFLAVVFIIAPFLPSCGLFLDVGFVVAERILFMPSIGYCLLLAYIVYQVLHAVMGASAAQKVVFLTVIIAVAGVYSARTIQRNEDWRTDRALYESGLAAFPGNCKMHHNYATTLTDPADVEKKEHHFREALKGNPRYGSAYANLGVVLAQNGRLEEAIQIWSEGVEKSARLVSDDRRVLLMNLALGYRNSGRLDEAEKYYKQAGEINRDERVMTALKEIRDLKKQQRGSH